MNEGKTTDAEMSEKDWQRRIMESEEAETSLEGELSDVALMRIDSCCLGQVICN